MPFTPVTMFLATRNTHKVAEIRGVLGRRFQYLTLNEFPDAPAVTEDAPSFAGNATKKAVELAGWLAAGISNRKFQISDSTWVLADDSGLEVDALNGAPGVWSARFAARDIGKRGNSSDSDNNAKLLRLLGGVPIEKRTARFRCVLAVTPILPNPPENASPVCLAGGFELMTQTFAGACEGRIAFSPRGRDGFGYDPLFMPESMEQTFAELGDAAKNQLSHRAKALAKLRARFIS